MEAVVGSRGFGHLLHDHLGLNVLLCSGIYCDVGPLKTKVYKQVDTNDYISRENIFYLCSFSDPNHIQACKMSLCYQFKYI